MKRILSVKPVAAVMIVAVAAILFLSGCRKVAGGEDAQTEISAGATAPQTGATEPAIRIPDRRSDRTEFPAGATAPQTGATEQFGIISGTETEETMRTAEELMKTLPGMPEGYELTAQEKRIKENGAAHHVDAGISPQGEGTLYTANEVFCLADSKEHAEQIAHAYAATLKSYTEGVAVFTLDPAVLSVAEAVRVGADLSNNMPLVEPNYIMQMYGR